MKLPDLIVTGWAEIISHKMRSFLSVFAIAIGIATTFYTLSILSQNYRNINRTAEISGTGRLDSQVDRPISMEQHRQLMQVLPPGSSVSLRTEEAFVLASYKEQPFSGFSMEGVLPSWMDSAFNYEVEGRFFNWQDIENKHRVAVIIVYPREKNLRDMYFLWDNHGVDTKLEDMAKHINLLNQQITLNGETFTVVGILRAPRVEKDFRAARDQERRQLILIPYSTWGEMLPYRLEYASTDLRIVTGDEKTAHLAQAELTSFLRQQFGRQFNPNIRLFRNELLLARKTAWYNLRSMFFIGLIAMIAGGIGIMNITMVIIFSRTREIGIRRALGATRLDILVQFLVEALLLGLCGAAGGIVLGYLAVVHMADNAAQMTSSWWVIATAVLLALATSFLFALYPAYQASKLKPVDALKYE